MEFTPHTGPVDKKRTHCLILGIHEKFKLTPSAEIINRTSDGLLIKILKREGFKANPGDTLLLHQLPGCRAERVLVTGLGRKKSLQPSSYAKSLDASIKTITSTRSKQVLCALLEVSVDGFDNRWKARQLSMRFEQGCYRFTEMKSEAGDLPELSSVGIHCPDKKDSSEVESGAQEGMAIASGMKLSKDLANLPGNVCTPTYLAEQALKLANQY
ncbi:MAG TPA: leucyl aminopeptidase, partial [Chromatiaceae bacterium]|nr:leucyl aminopeptidase [Chromatiaceae bacterium]